MTAESTESAESSESPESNESRKIWCKPKISESNKQMNFRQFLFRVEPARQYGFSRRLAQFEDTTHVSNQYQSTGKKANNTDDDAERTSGEVSIEFGTYAAEGILSKRKEMDK